MYNSLTASFLIGNEYNQNKNHSSLCIVRGGRWAQGERRREQVTVDTVFTKPLKEDE